jgi:hypothetical protein
VVPAQKQIPWIRSQIEGILLETVERCIHGRLT